MNDMTTPATFSFVSHKVRKFSFSEPKTNQTNLSIEFDPSGEYNLKSGVFKLVVIFTAKYGEKNEHIFSDVTTEGYFQFPALTQIEQFPEYFYANSIAILFPYIRAFLSTLTSVANLKQLILPTLNLSALAEPLKKNIKVVSTEFHLPH